MDNIIVTQQLSNEIDKLKERDYSSYQNFYSQTSEYIYGIIWQQISEKEAADKLIADVYTEIYETIGTELADNNMFYEWVKSKTEKTTTTYINTNGLEKDNETKKAAAAAGVGIVADASTGVGTGAGAAAGGMAGAIGAETVAGGTAASVGTGAFVGVGKTAGGMATSVTTGVAKKVAVGVATKIAIGVAVVATVAIGIAAVTLNKDKDDSDNEPVASATDIASVETEEATESEEATETTETTEEEPVVDPELAERANAYYNMLTVDGMMPVKESDEYGFQNQCKLLYSNIRLVDFAGNGKKQIVIVDADNNLVDVYDYVNGNVENILSVDYTNTEYNYTATANVQSRVILKTATDGTSTLIVADPDQGYSILEYSYDNGTFTSSDLMGEATNYVEIVNALDDDTSYTYDFISSDGASPTGASNYEWEREYDRVSRKCSYDRVIEELVIQGGIDTSEVWKRAYALKLQELRDNFYSNDYSGTQNEGATYKFALQDLNGDGIPELIGMFTGWDGGANFMMSCSKYGTYDYLGLQSGNDLSVSNNYFDVENGRVRTNTKYLDELEVDSVYVMDRGCFIMVGNYESYYTRMSNEMVHEWAWADYDAASGTYSPTGNLSEADFNSKAESFVGIKTFDSVFTYVEDIDEITNMIENY